MEPAQSRTEHARRSPRSQDAVQRPGRSHSSVRRTREFRGLDEAAKGDRAAQCVPRSTPPRRHGWGTANPERCELAAERGGASDQSFAGGNCE
jgi:hypothetical protein